MNRRNAIVCSAAALTLVLGGCSSYRPQQASMGMLGSNNTVLSLGAGDTLGRAVYVNDMILAAAKLDGDTTYTNVDQGAVETMSDPRP